MKNKPLLTGALVGIIANVIGLFICVQIFGNGEDLFKTIKLLIGQ